MGNVHSEVEQVIPGALIYKVRSDLVSSKQSNGVSSSSGGSQGAQQQKNGLNGTNFDGNGSSEADLQRQGKQIVKSVNANVDETGETYVFDANYEGDSDEDYEYRILWSLVAYWIVTHSLGAFAIYRIFSLEVKWQTVLFGAGLFYVMLLGIPAGAHRLWAHKSYKAKWPLKAFLTFLCSVAASGSIWSWSVIHRIHHKYSETDADPVNSNRGFWFSHIGWTMQTAHPKVVEKAKTLDFSDLENDPFVRFNRDHYTALTIICCYFLPTYVPVYFWNESIVNAFVVCAVLRHLMQLHGTFSINSFAHMYGNKPYNHKIAPTENFWANLYTFGEGFHNYHHTFPWDYRASEWGWSLNLTSIFLDAMSSLGLAYDMKFANQKMIDNTKDRNQQKLNEIKANGNKKTE